MTNVTTSRVTTLRHATWLRVTTLRRGYGLRRSEPNRYHIVTSCDVNISDVAISRRLDVKSYDVTGYNVTTLPVTTIQRHDDTRFDVTASRRYDVRHVTVV